MLAAFLVRPPLLVTFQEKVLAAVGAITSTIDATWRGIDRKWERLGRKRYRAGAGELLGLLWRVWLGQKCHAARFCECRRRATAMLPARFASPAET